MATSPWAGLRDSRIDRVINLARPVDYLIADYLTHPNLFILYQEWLLRACSTAPTRLPMPELRCSCVPPSTSSLTQIHHGTADLAVPVESALAFERVRGGLNLPAGRHQVHLYEGDGHSLAQSIGEVGARIDAFVEDLFEP